MEAKISIKNRHQIKGFASIFFTCPNCENYLVQSIDTYCSHCGSTISWFDYPERVPMIFKPESFNQTELTEADFWDGDESDKSLE